MTKAAEKPLTKGAEEQAPARNATTKQRAEDQAQARNAAATSAEMSTFRRSWAGVVAVLAVNPLVLPQRSLIEELRAAVPEVRFMHVAA